MTTVQDLGRWGHQATGVSVAGPMDRFSHRLASLLVGNEANAAGLEITLAGPELEFERAAVVAVCGADFDLAVDGENVATHVRLEVPAGACLRFGRRHAGARAYLAVAGGIQTPIVLGSRATHILTAIGGVNGRALVAGDRLPVPAHGSAQRPVRSAVRGVALPQNGRAELRVLPGPHYDWFTSEALDAFSRTAYAVSPRSDRMGYRLSGAALPRHRLQEPISAPVACGTVQVPPAGEPILLMADAQTTGGYVRIASVIAADLPLAGQLAPGDGVTFRISTRQQAAAALIASERLLLRLADEAGL